MNKDILIMDDKIINAHYINLKEYDCFGINHNIGVKDNIGMKNYQTMKVFSSDYNILSTGTKWYFYKYNLSNDKLVKYKILEIRGMLKYSLVSYKMVDMNRKDKSVMKLLRPYRINKLINENV